MIKQFNDSKTFLEIVDKLKDVPDCRLKESTFYTYMIAGLYNEATLTFASYSKEKMNGCAVLTIGKDIMCELTLFIVFLWLDPHNRKLWRKYMEFIEDKARELKAVKISFTTARSAEAIDRRLGKYGYSKVYNVIEKEIKNVI